MKMSSLLVLMLGGNLEGTSWAIEKSKTLLINLLGELVSESGLYLTAPWGITDQPPFLNKALVLSTKLDPDKILKICRNTELKLGRKKGLLNGPRLIDIDIMFIGQLILDTEKLIIPHPRLHIRKFNLVPLTEVIPDFIHPVLGKSIFDLNENCQDELSVRKINLN